MSPRLACAEKSSAGFEPQRDPLGGQALGETVRQQPGVKSGAALRGTIGSGVAGRLGPRRLKGLDVGFRVWVSGVDPGPLGFAESLVQG